MSKENNENNKNNDLIYNHNDGEHNDPIIIDSETNKADSIDVEDIESDAIKAKAIEFDSTESDAKTQATKKFDIIDTRKTEKDEIADTIAGDKFWTDKTPDYSPYAAKSSEHRATEQSSKGTGSSESGMQPGMQPGMEYKSTEHTRKKKGIPLAGKFFIAFVFSLMLFIVVAVAAVYITTYKPIGDTTPEFIRPTPKDLSGYSDEPTGIDDYLPEVQEEVGMFAMQRKTNFLVMGRDASDQLTDVILVVGYDNLTKKTEVLSIPRDTRIEIYSEINEKIKERSGKSLSKFVKTSEISSYVGRTHAAYAYTLIVQNLLKITLDYYVVLDLEAFRYIVDAVGGVEFTVRDKGYYYSAPDQNLLIDIPGGFQRLYGKEAEGVVRYRNDYALGDEGRIAIQQDFMKAFFEQVLNKNSIMNNALSYFEAFITYMETDFSLVDFTKYAGVLVDIKPENISFKTLPGYGTTIEGTSYFVYNSAKTLDYVLSTFNNYDNPNYDISEADTHLLVKVLNGSDKKDIANEKTKLLFDNDINALSGGAYTGDKQDYTRIVVRDKSDGECFPQFFKSSTIEVDAEMTGDFDVVIIVGTGE